MGAYLRMGAYFRMGAYKRNVVVEIKKMGADIHEVLILCGCLLSRFYGMSPTLSGSTIVHQTW